jgi:hypothetical protein
MMKRATGRRLSGTLVFGRRINAAIIIGGLFFSTQKVIASEREDVGRRLEEICGIRDSDWGVKQTLLDAEAKMKASFIAENRAAIIAYVERRVDEVQRPKQYTVEASYVLISMCGFAVETDKEKGLTLCLRLLRNMERTLLIVEDFLFDRKVNCSEVLGEGGTKFVRLVQHTIRELLGTFQHYHSSLAVPDAKRYLLLEWPHMGLDINALDYLMARGIDDLEVRAWLEALAKDPNSRLNTKDYLAVRWKAYKKW